MTGRPDPLDRHRLRTAARIAPRGPEPPRSGWLARLSGRQVAAGTVAVQVAVLFAVLAIEPAPSDATVAWQWIGELLAGGYLVALVAGGLLVDWPSRSLRASGIAGALGLGLAVGCPATGHHEMAAWWFGEIGLFAAAAAAPLLARRLLRRG